MDDGNPLNGSSGTHPASNEVEPQGKVLEFPVLPRIQERAKRELLVDEVADAVEARVEGDLTHIRGAVADVLAEVRGKLPDGSVAANPTPPEAVRQASPDAAKLVAWGVGLYALLEWATGPRRALRRAEEYAELLESLPEPVNVYQTHHHHEHVTQHMHEHHEHRHEHHRHATHVHEHHRHVTERVMPRRAPALTPHRTILDD